MEQNDHDLLIRLDENMKSVLIELKSMREDSLERIKAIEEDKVSRKEFAPVKLITYGLVGLLVAGVVGELLKLALK